MNKKLGLTDESIKRIAYSLEDPYDFPSKYKDKEEWESLGQDILYVMMLSEAGEVDPVVHPDSPDIDYAHSALSIALEELRRDNYSSAWDLYQKAIKWYKLPSSSIIREQREDSGWTEDVEKVYKGPMGS